jgi:ABC-type multidrug transport system fused ATPase/permease subunit
MDIEEGYGDFEKEQKFVKYDVKTIAQFEEYEKTKSVIDVVPHGKVEFQKVTAKYLKGEKPVLKNISFTLEPGKKVGIVGRSGSGKSTIVKLFWRYLDPLSGKILIDGKNINTHELKSLRRSLNIISQDIILFNATLRRNIDLLDTYLITEEDNKRITGFLEYMGFENEQYIKNGLDMIVEHEGSNLS